MQEMQEMGVQPLGWEDPLEKEMATHSSILFFFFFKFKQPNFISHDSGAWEFKIKVLFVLEQPHG